MLVFAMSTPPEAGVRSARVRRLTLGLAVLQAILGLALTALSFITFSITEVDRLRKSCPYWAGIIVRNLQFFLVFILCVCALYVRALRSFVATNVCACVRVVRVPNSVSGFPSVFHQVCFSGAVGIIAWKRSSALSVGLQSTFPLHALPFSFSAARLRTVSLRAGFQVRNLL